MPRSSRRCEPSCPSVIRRDRFPVVVADLGLARVGPRGGLGRPGVGGPPRRARRQRRCDLPRTPRRARRDRGDVRAPRRRAVRARGGSAAVASRHAGRAGHRGHLGRHVHPGGSTSTTSRRARPSYSGPRTYARAKRAQTALMREWARRSAPSGVSLRGDAPGLGRHARARRHAARRSTGRSARSCGPRPTAPTRSSGSPPGRIRWRRPGASSSTGGRGPSTASRPRGSRPPTGGGSGTSWSSLPAAAIPRRTAEGRRSATPADRSGDHLGGIDDARGQHDRAPARNEIRAWLPPRRPR